jgi:hypothetical protein
MKGAAFFSTNKSQDIFNIRFTGTTFNFTHYFADDGTIKRALVGISGYPTSYSGVTRSAGGTGTTRPYIITGLTAGEKIAQIKTFNTGEIGRTSIQAGPGLIGNLDFSKWNKIEAQFSIVGTNSLTGVTNPQNWKGITNSLYNLSVSYGLQSTGLKDLDISMFNRVRDIDVLDNLSLSSITLPSLYIAGSPRNIDFSNNRLIGDLDFSCMNNRMNVTTYSFDISSNFFLTGVTFPNVGARVASVGSPQLFGQNNNITGNLNLSMLSGFPVNISFRTNPNLTGITLPTQAAIFSSPTNSCISNGITNFDFAGCNLQGTLDLSIFPNFGGSSSVGEIDLRFNTGLTSVFFTSTTKNFRSILLSECDLTGNLNLSGFTGRLGGRFDISLNPNLTGITFSSACTYNQNVASVTNQFLVDNCNLTGTLDLSKITGLGGSFACNNNTNLNQILHGPSSSANTFSYYLAYNCNLTGTHDLTPLSGLSGSIQIFSNTGLTDVLFPVTINTFNNGGVSENDSALTLYGNGLNYVDFKPLSGSTFSTNSRIRLQNNGMTASEVNQILVDFSGNATYNLTGWDSIDLNIGGSNANPDNSSGGFDGLAAVAFLTGSPQNWTITY